MVISPQTEIRLVKVPLTLDNKNQITFNNLQSQLDYFLNLPYLTLDDATYLRKEGVLRFDKSFDTCINYNYVMYKNSSYSNKWFFAFITGMEYRANEVTYIKIETDVFQTWQFEMVFKPSFVERDMLYVEDDVPRCKFSA